MRAAAVLLLAFAAVHASAFHEDFSKGWETRWIHSDDEKYTGRFVVESPSAGSDDLALKVPEKAKHYGIAASLSSPVSAASEPLVLQFEVKLTEGLACGGAYLKFLTADAAFEPAALKDDTPYTIMFGPDKCGATNKVHLILRHKSPKTGAVEEKHLRFPPAIVDDDLTHVYTAVLRASNASYAVLVDGVEKKAGSLFEDFDPAFVPPTEIDDPADSKPATWVDEAKIADPAATKPEDWDEDAPEFVPDEEAEKPEGWLDDEPAEVDDESADKPEDWDDEEDGDWEPPKVANPKCKEAPGCGEWVRPTKRNPEFKGKWSAPMIDNPAYKGPWAPRKIANPDFFNDTAPLSHIGDIGAVAVEIWTMEQNYYFGHILVTNSPGEAEELRDEVWAPKYNAEKAASDKKKAEEAAEAEKKAAEEAAKAKSAPAAGASGGVLGRLTSAVTAAVDAVFDSALLAPHAATLAPLRGALSGSPMGVLAVLTALVALLLTPVLMGKGENKPQVGEAPKPAAAAPAKKAANGKKKEEIQEEEDEDEEEDEEEETEAKTAPRRTRRD